MIRRADFTGNSPLLKDGLHCHTTCSDGLIIRAEFRVPKHLSYIRGVVRDEQGRRAWTNPIFLNP